MASQYDEVMLNCLKVTGYEKPAAIKMFNANFPHLPVTYAYKVYERVIGAVGATTEFSEMIGEMVGNLRRAGQATLQRGLTHGDWNPFTDVVNLQMRVAQVEAAPTLNQQNVYLSKPPEEMRNELQQLKNVIAGGGSFTPALPSNATVEATPEG